MQVDSGTQAFLETLRGMGGKPLYELTIAEAREAVRGLSQLLGGIQTEVHEVSDRTIATPSGEVGIRLYWPRAVNPEHLLPIVMHYHGGGFFAGDLDSHDALARYYCKHAAALVVSVDYRRPPEHKFPIAVEDSYAALCWAADHARELGGDAGRLAVTGDSAGGNLAAVMCQLAKARRGPRIAFQALAYPCTDLDLSADYPSRRLFGDGAYFLSSRDMEWFTSMYLSDAVRDVKDPRASPLVERDVTGLPPAFVMTTGFDLLRDEGKAYADRLAAAGVPVESRCFESTIHACMSFRAAIPTGEEALSLLADRLRTATAEDGSVATL